MTKFTSLDQKVNKKTVFEKVVDVGTDGLLIKNTTETINAYDNVLYIGYDLHYGDVFKCWLDDDEADFTLFFGRKGTEF